MDLVELGCACLTLPQLKVFMDFASYPGKGITAPLIGVLILAYGYYRADQKLKRLGWTILVSLAAVALLANGLKVVIRSPRPTPRTGYGFPSGDSATAFSLAATLSAAYPIAAPILFLLASLAAISRLYFRAHYVWDIISGAALGTVCGFFTAMKLLPDRAKWSLSGIALATWIPSGLLLAGAFSFFIPLEREIAKHKLPLDLPHEPAAMAAWVDFGVPAARNQLMEGWSGNRTWRNPNLTINWAEGLYASVTLPIAKAQDYLLLIRMYPYRPQGFFCQSTDIKINDHPLPRIYLEQDWNSYELKIAKRLVRNGENRLDFRFTYSDRTNWHGINPDQKPLSVAFDILYLVSDPSG